MSGQPVKTKADQAKFLDEYMENLALEIELNKQNFDANRVYKQTGQLPAVSSMPDNRTVEEKLADVELLRQGIIKDVGKIISPNLAVALVDEIQKSKFNTDNSLLRFFAQRAPEFMRELEKKYKYGLKDYNDIVGTVKFIEKYFTEAQDSLASLKDIAGRNPFIESKRVDKDTFKTLADELKKVARTLFKMNNPFIDEIITQIDKISNVIPSQVWFEQRISDCIHLKSIPGIEEEFPELADYEKFIKEYSQISSSVFPQRDLILSINSGILKASQSSYPRGEKIDIIDRYLTVLTKELDQITPDLVMRISYLINNIADIYQYHKEIFDLLNKPVESMERGGSEGIPNEPRGIPNEPQGQRRQPGQSSTSSQWSETSTLAGLSRDTGSLLGESKEDEGLEESKSGEADAYTNDKYREAYDDIIKLNGDVSNLINPEDYTDLSARGKLNSTLEVKAIINDIENSFYRDIGVSGYGIHRIKGRGLTKPHLPFVARIDRTAGITASPEFVPFGSYLLNRRKIGDGIVALKTASGSNIHGFPNKRISQKLTKVFHKIAGGALPSFEDLGSLDEEEKEYLHKIAKKANLLDRLSIPSPSKDEREKDVHNFEVMKGEIMSGNDNKDLIKKFKLLVLKLKNQELLPKSQADEILSDLTSIGY